MEFKNLFNLKEGWKREKMNKESRQDKQNTKSKMVDLNVIIFILY